MNKCVFMGFISSDIKGEDMNLKEGNTMRKARFSIACSRKTKNNTADFIQITALGKNAENIEKFFTKGKGIIVECHVNTGKYTNKEGKTVFTTDFVMDGFEFPPIRRDEVENSTPVSDTTESEPSTNDTHTEEPPAAPDDFVTVSDSDLEELPFR